MPQSVHVPYRDLKVFEATESAVDRISQLIDGPSGDRMLHVWQLRRSAQAISANIAEGFGRGEGRDRTRVLRIARGEAEETIRHPYGEPSREPNWATSVLDHKELAHRHRDDVERPGTQRYSVASTPRS